MRAHAPLPVNQTLTFSFSLEFGLIDSFEGGFDVHVNVRLIGITQGGEKKSCSESAGEKWNEDSSSRFLAESAEYDFHTFHALTFIP